MMKLLIVEDEVILRKGICTLIHWDTLGFQVVGDCANGLEALSFLQHQPVDLVISDIKMPGMNGLELAEQIKLNFPETKTILLTAYSDFDFAKKAIQFGVVDYVIKADFVKTLPSAVLRAKEQLLIRRLHIAENESREELMPLVLSGILNGVIIEEHDISEWLQKLQLTIEHFFVLKTIIKWKQPAKKNSNQQRDELAIQNFYHLAFEQCHYCSAWVDPTTFVVIVSFPENQELINTEKIISVANEILATVESYMPFEIQVGVSHQHQNPLNIREAYQEAGLVLEPHASKANSLAIHQAPDNNDIRLTNEEKKHLSSQLTKLLLQKNPSATDYLLHHTLARYSEFAPLEVIKIDLILILSECLRSLVCTGAEMHSFDLFFPTCEKRIKSCPNLADLKRTLQNCINEALQYDLTLATQCNYLVLDVNRYIKEHYQDSFRVEDLSLHLHVNSSYLSRIYKKNTGLSVVSALNNYRINCAKELLLQDLAVYQVANMVGFDDPAYFSNVFAKYVNCSPSEYKKECLHLAGIVSSETLQNPFQQP